LEIYSARLRWFAESRRSNDCARVLRYAEPSGQQIFSTAGVMAVQINPFTQSRVGRIAWSYFRHPMKSREFPAKHERLITQAELLRYGV
jgi:hypothetical protein